MGINKQGHTHADPESNDFDTVFKKYNSKKNRNRDRNQT